MTTNGNGGGGRAGIGFVGALQLALIVLKLCGVITWAWIWVLTPVWVSALFGAGIVSLVIAGGILYAIVTAQRDLPPARHDDERTRSLHGPVRKWGYRHTNRTGGGD